MSGHFILLRTYANMYSMCQKLILTLLLIQIRISFFYF